MLRNKKKRTIHSYSGVVFGCTLSYLVNFAEGKYKKSDAIQCMVNALRPAKIALYSCGGEDADVLRNGMLDMVVIRGQLASLQRKKRIDSKYGKSNSVIGAATAMFAILNVFALDCRDAGSVLLITVIFAKRLLSTLQKWRSSEPLQSDHRASADCEMRALQRSIVAMEVAKEESERRNLNTYESLQLELEYVRCGIWPTDSEIGEGAQHVLCEQIRLRCGFEPQKRPVRQSNSAINFVVPLSQTNCVLLTTDVSQNVAC